MRTRLAGMVFVVCCFVPSLHAQSYFQILQAPVLSEAERHSMMYSFVDRNLPAIELPSTLREWESRKPQLRAQILKDVGLEDLDRRGPVKWISKGIIDRDGYTIEKIIYESYPGMWVPALVYAPKGLRAPAPAMVSIPGHEYCEGKSGESIQARGVNLARRGLIVISYDYIDTFERNTGLNPCATMPYGGGNDHGLSAFSFTGGGKPTGLEILDGIRAIDYLYTRKDVDRNRIGFTGESGGGNSTYWLAALDSRIHLAVSVVAVTSFDYWIRNDRDWDWHQRPFGIRRVADIWTLLALAAPRPLLVISSLRGTDSSEAPVEQAEIAVHQARKVYDLYGKGGDIQLWQSSTSHGFQLDKRQRMYAWVEKYFFGHNVEWSKEMPFTFEPQTELVCGLPSANKTLKDIYREWLQRPTPVPELPQSKGDLSAVQRPLRERLVNLLALPARTPDPRVTVLLITSRADVVIRQLAIETQAGIRLPAIEIEPRERKPNATVIFLNKSKDFFPAIPEMISLGQRVVLVDLRGVGEIDSGGGRTNNWAWLMGRPWPGLWVEDVKGVIAAISAEYPGSPIGLVGTGRLGKTALFAAALDGRIAAVMAQLDDMTYREEALKDGLADVPGILTIMDMPQVVGLVAPRPCWIQVQEKVTDPELQSNYAWSIKLYQRVSGAGQALRLEQESGEDWKSVAEWFADQLKAVQ